jgi:hypothetical protein
MASGKGSLWAMWGTDTQDAHLGNRYKVPAGSIPGSFAWVKVLFHLDQAASGGVRHFLPHTWQNAS